MCPECFGNAGSHGKLAQAIANQLRPAVLAEFDKAMAAVFVAGAEVGPFLHTNLLLDIIISRTCALYSLSFIGCTLFQLHASHHVQCVLLQQSALETAWESATHARCVDRLHTTRHSANKLVCDHAAKPVTACQMYARGDVSPSALPSRHWCIFICALLLLPGSRAS